MQVFNERGYDGTSMEHLSKAAGISKSSIYHHVAGKEELLRRAVSRALDGLFGILDEEHAREGHAAERLEYVVRRMVEVLIAELPTSPCCCASAATPAPSAGPWSAAATSTTGSPNC